MQANPVSFKIKHMRKHDQVGSTSVVLCVVLSILFVAVSGFAFWAFSGRQDYKNNSDKKSAKAVSAAETAQAAKLKTQFDEEAKNPNKIYTGPAVAGSVTFGYPKTWSAYVDESGSSQIINGYLHPNIVPGLQTTTAFALRVEVSNSAYAEAVKQMDSFVKIGKVKAAAYLPPKMGKVAGVQPGMRFDGAISNNQSGDLQGAMVVLPVRDKTLKIYTQSPTFLADFNNIILPSLTFSP